VGNGYPNAGDFGSQYGVALDAQPDNSHGLCQTFALMYYYGEESLLSPGKYQTNIRDGLKWLARFTTANDWQWSSNEEVTTSRAGREAAKLQLREILAGTNIRGNDVYLSDLVAWLRNPRQARYLAAWAYDLGPDM
jgi:hypothetical protein